MYVQCMYKIGRQLICAVTSGSESDLCRCIMSSVKEPLLGAQPEYSDYRSVNNEATIVAVEPARRVQIIDESVCGDDGERCVSFHDVSYEVSSCFGRRRKVILDSVR